MCLKFSLSETSNLLLNHFLFIGYIFHGVVFVRYLLVCISI